MPGLRVELRKHHGVGINAGQAVRVSRAGAARTLFDSSAGVKTDWTMAWESVQSGSMVEDQ